MTLTAREILFLSFNNELLVSTSNILIVFTLKVVSNHDVGSAHAIYIYIYISLIAYCPFCDDFNLTKQAMLFSFCNLYHS